MASCQKLGIILVINGFKNWFYQKMSITTNVLLDWYSLMKKKIQKDSDNFWHRKLTLKIKFWHFLKNRHYSKFKNSINSFEFVDFWAKTFLFLYPWLENSTTSTAITQTVVLYICINFWLLAHESRSSSQAETKMILVKSWTNSQNENCSRSKLWFFFKSDHFEWKKFICSACNNISFSASDKSRDSWANSQKLIQI